MPAHLSVESVIDKNRISSDAAWIILLDIHLADPNTREVVDIIHIAKNNEAVTFGKSADGTPIVYAPGNFTINIDQRQNEASNVSISARDEMRLIESRMEAMAGGVFSEVVMTVVNTDRLDQPPEIQERFQIINSSVKNYVVNFTLGSENPLAIQFPRSRQFKDRCSRRFRGYGCPYTGPLQTCDYTKDGPNGCVAHGMVEWFRGLPGLVKMNM